MMKIRYSSEDVRISGNEIQKSHPDLYRLWCFEHAKVKKMDWDDFNFYKQEELVKSDKSKTIKQIGKEELYEFRLPPVSKKSVLRIEFTLDGDCYTICISRFHVKSIEPKQQSLVKKL